jgi:phosphatidylserine/phosphatidylglycerophosphate/cardiolipin synthase-like enzyme
MVHSKIALFDRKEAFLGTSNLDNLSMVYNYECGFKILNKQCVSEIDTYITSDLLAGTTKIDLNSWEERSFLLKMLEKIVKLFRKFL